MKTNIGLVEYCRKQVGNPYWWDTYGQISSEELYLKKKKDYPNYYTNDDYKSQYGKRVFDCSGLIKGYLWSSSLESDPIYNCTEDFNSNEIFNLCKIRGDIKNLPEVLGILLFFPGHVGVYIGNGKAIEARGHDYGVIESNVSDRPWKSWGKFNLITYIHVKSHHIFKT